MTDTSQGLWSMGKGQFEMSVRQLERAIVRHGGDPCQLFQRLRINDDNYADKVARFMVDFDRDGQGSTGRERAREIMGKNFLGQRDAIIFLRVRKPEEVLALAEVPFSEKLLVQLKDTHILVAVPSVSINDMRDITVGRLVDPFHNESWCKVEQENFAINTDRAKWCLLRKYPLERSTSKTWDEQKLQFGLYDMAPSARVVIYANTLYRMINDEWPLEGKNVRTSSINTNGLRIILSFHRSAGIILGADYDRERLRRVGAITMRKPPERPDDSEQKT